MEVMERGGDRRREVCGGMSRGVVGRIAAGVKKIGGVVMMRKVVLHYWKAGCSMVEALMALCSGRLAG